MKTKPNTSLWIGGIGCIAVLLYFPLSIWYADYKWSHYKKVSRPIASTLELQQKMDLAHSNVLYIREHKPKKK